MSQEANENHDIIDHLCKCLCCCFYSDNSDGFAYTPLATAEYPTPIGEIESRKLERLGPPVSADYVTLPYLTDDSLALCLLDHRFIIIMQGVPGTGKSFITNCLMRRFPQAIVCSADQFWYNRSHDGKTYAFDEELKPQAHEWCRQEAEKAMRLSHSPVIIDNTNIQPWEIKPYTEFARKYGYHVLFAEPQTLWRNDANELFRRNQHSVLFAVIERKLASYETIISPRFGGLFLLPALSDKDGAIDNSDFVSWTATLISIVLNQPPVQNYLSEVTQAMSVDQILAQWKCTGDTCIPGLGHVDQAKRSLYHITFFLGGGKIKPNEREFYASDEYERARHGALYSVSVLGLFMSSRTLGLHVRLPFDGRPELKRLWRMNDQEVVSGGRADVHNRMLGTRAHFTLATLGSATLAESGRDLLRLVDNLSSAELLANVDEGCVKRIKLFSKPGSLSDSIHYLQLNSPKQINCIFGGHI